MPHLSWRAFNERLAVKVTLAAFTMEAVYLCVLLSLLPIVNAAWMETILFISNAVQLTLLSVVGVGTAVLSRKQEERAAEDHNALVEILADMREEHAARHDELRQLVGSEG